MSNHRRPTWAVVIPTYNDAARIGDALHSLRRQTEPADEIVVCDDGSTDDLDTALAPFAGDFRVVRQKNSGAATARNTGASEVESDWILFLDADDHLAPNFLERLRDVALEQPDLALIGSEAEGYDEVDGRVLYRHYRDREIFSLTRQREAILARNFLLTGVSVRRQQWAEAGRFDERVRSCEDWDCWMRMILRGARAGLVEDTLLYRRHHGGNISANHEQMLYWRIVVLGWVVKRADLTLEEREVAFAAMDEDLRALKVIEGRKAVRAVARADGFRAGLSARLATCRLVVSKHVSVRHRLGLAIATVLPLPSRLLPRRVR